MPPRVTVTVVPAAIMTGLGIVALAGIVVKNGIVLIDTYNHYNRGDGVEPPKAYASSATETCRASRSGSASRPGSRC